MERKIRVIEIRVRNAPLHLRDVRREEMSHRERMLEDSGREYLGLDKLSNADVTALMATLRCRENYLSYLAGDLLDIDKLSKAEMRVLKGAIKVKLTAPSSRPAAHAEGESTGV